jgi:AraC-like DNA-binding protein
VEFNRRGLYLEGDSLFAGSINGLYVLDAKHLDQLADRVAKSSGEQSLPVYFLSLLIGIALIAITFIYLHYRSRGQLKQIIAETQIASLPKLTREDIETFIKENLAQASLKSIAEKFKTNNAVIYTLLSPEKPGAFINRLRMEQVKRLRKDGKPAREISQLTGFSEYYVRKVWNVNQ